jgi:predicted metalloprotease with PDZ domain
MQTELAAMAEQFHHPTSMIWWMRFAIEQLPVFKFDVNGARVAMVGRNNADLEKLRDDMQLMQNQAKVVNDHPCKLPFIVQNVENGGGGLEHKNSTVLMMVAEPIQMLRDKGFGTRGT